MPKTAIPPFIGGSLQHGGFGRDGFHRIEIECRNPCRRNVSGKWREIGKIAPGFAARFRQYDHHVAVVARRNADFDSGDDFGIAVEQLHLAGLKKRFVIDGAVAHGIARMLFAGVRQFPQRVTCALLSWEALREALGLRKGDGGPRVTTEN